MNEPKLDHAGSHLLTVNDVAHQLSVSARTVRRLIEKGDLPYHRIGRAIRISGEDLSVFLKRAKR